MKDIFCKIVDSVEGFFLNIFRKIGLGKFVDWYMEHQEAMRYLVFGGLTTVVNIVVFMLLKTFCDFGTTINNTIAWILSVIFAYITNKLCVFNSETTSSKGLLIEIASFFGARVGTLVVETGFLKLVIDVLHQNELLMKIVSNIIVIILNFVLSKLFIFKNKDTKQEEK